MSQSKNRILITGSNGLLGQTLTKHFIENQIEFLATANSENKISYCPDNDFRTLNIQNKEQVKEVIQEFNPTHIINAAAMTNVDACKDEVERCFGVNATGVKNILEAIENTEIHLIQISTDFIFDGQKKSYSEEDTANPLSNYGKSKWDGEQIIFKSGFEKVTILRTSIVYGVGEKLNKGNIFNWSMQELRKGNQLKIVNDQFRTPTFVEDLVQACQKVIDSNSFGVYNIAGGELKSMFDYIILVAEYLKVDTDLVSAITSKNLNQKAKRPISSGLIIDKAKKGFDYNPTDFMVTLSKIDPEN